MNLKRNFCTYFDENYFVKGLCLIRSLQKHCPNFVIFVLCLDDFTFDNLKKLDINSVKLIHLSKIENPEILEAKYNRNIIEYYWTLTPCLPWFILKNHPSIEQITYLDSDIYFFSNPEIIFSEISNSSIAIIEHRLPKIFSHLKEMGQFCVEWVTFRNDKEGLRCINHWKKECISWCYDKNEQTRMGDQKYLDYWPKKFKNLHIIRNIGAGIAPWNYSMYDIKKGDNGMLTTNNVNLVYYHFHQFILLENNCFDWCSEFYKKQAPPPRLIYETYQTEFETQIKYLNHNHPRIKINKTSFFKNYIRRFVQKNAPIFLKKFIKAILSLFNFSLR
jgi:hypothetical protein